MFRNITKLIHLFFPNSDITSLLLIGLNLYISLTIGFFPKPPHYNLVDLKMLNGVGVMTFSLFSNSFTVLINSSLLTSDTTGLYLTFLFRRNIGTALEGSKITF